MQTLTFKTKQSKVITNHKFLLQWVAAGVDAPVGRRRSGRSGEFLWRRWLAEAEAAQDAAKGQHGARRARRSGDGRRGAEQSGVAAEGALVARKEWRGASAR